jgi:O-6-methylguanine DNA methyltransferase
MKKEIQKYLLKLSRAGIDLDFGAVSCRYGNFTIYCLLGPEEKVLQVTFAPEKHERLQKQLRYLDRTVRIRKLQQKKTHLDPLFAEYFSGKRTSFPGSMDSPLIAAGTDFQKRVWRQIEAIPYAGHITYQELATLAGCPKGARAAGMACGANPMSLIIPCHRVVAVNGLGGFAGGAATKKALQALEQRVRNNPG